MLEIFLGEYEEEASPESKGAASLLVWLSVLLYMLEIV